MSTDTESSPTPSALTRTEWANVREQLAADPAHRRTLVEFAASGNRWDAAAAIALHEQPYGFTREDLLTLATAMVEAQRNAASGRDDADAQRRLAERISDIAGRIARLLPERTQRPEEAPGTE